MKKSIQTAFLFLISLPVMAQPYINLQVNNKGAGIGIGMLANKIEVAFNYQQPFTKNDVPNILSLAIGRQILLSQHNEDNYSITPSLGIGHYRVKDFADYNADPTGKAGIQQISEMQPIFGLELGKDSYMGRVSVTANYCKGFYFGVGLKVFMYR